MIRSGLIQKQIINSIQKSIDSQIKNIFLKLTGNMLLTRRKFRHIGIDMDGACQFCNKKEESIDYIFRTCDLASNLWFTINIHCPNP